MARIRSLDTARGFTVLVMPSIHVVMLYSRPEVARSFLGGLLAFLAEGPGAQLFMLLMGVSMVLSGNATNKSTIKRSLKLVIAACTLNILKFVVPFTLGIFPESLLTELHWQEHPLTSMLLMGDILHFAAIAYPVSYAVYRLPRYFIWATVLAVIVIFLSPFLWDLRCSNSLVDYGLTLLGGHPPDVFFPVFPWLVYPLAGITIGHCLKKFAENKVFYGMAITGIILIAIGKYYHRDMATPWLHFYRTLPADTTYHLGFVLAWLGLCKVATTILKETLFSLLLQFLSKHITIVYLVQWILICWILPFTGYHTLGIRPSLYWMSVVSMLSFFLAYLFKTQHVFKKDV